MKETAVYDQARLRAVEELVIALLKRAPEALDALLEAASEPVPNCLIGDDSGEGRRMLEYCRTVQAAKRQLITRARYPDGVPSHDELALDDDLGPRADRP